MQIRSPDGSLRNLTLDSLSPADQSWVRDRTSEIRRLNSGAEIQLLALRDRADSEESPEASAPAILSFFKPFDETLKFRWDDNFLYVGSNGMPDHRIMVGITAWQQQVPLPQHYFNENSWRIPLNPVVARTPLSAKDNFFRGAIALAVNGVPIFNPIKNDGRTDTLLAGELDEFGGHCGRADDYHYHVAPVHLEPKVGKGNPLAFALDGYPLLGYDEPDGSPALPLDAMNGHEDEDGHYHYHATKTYPYVNGGFHGEISLRGGQVDPQPHAEPLRSAQSPLPGATITAFHSPKPGSYRLTYLLGGQEHFVNYSLGGHNDQVSFEFADHSGASRVETYRRAPTDRRGGPPGFARWLLAGGLGLGLISLLLWHQFARTSS